MIIIFNMEATHAACPQNKNPKLNNWGFYKEHLKLGLTNLVANADTIESLNQLTTQLGNIFVLLLFRMHLGQSRLKISKITSMIRTNPSLSRGRKQWVSLDSNLYSNFSAETKEGERKSCTDFFPEKANQRHLGETKCREAFGSNQNAEVFGSNNA